MFSSTGLSSSGHIGSFQKFALILLFIIFVSMCQRFQKLKLNGLKQSDPTFAMSILISLEENSGSQKLTSTHLLEILSRNFC